MSKIKANLKSGGYLVCVDWFSKQDSAWKIAPKKFKKLHTILNIKKGDLKGVGTTHFASVSILEEIFKGWKLIHFEEKIKKKLDILIITNKELFFHLFSKKNEKFFE